MEDCLSEDDVLLARGSPQDCSPEVDEEEEETALAGVQAGAADVVVDGRELAKVPHIGGQALLEVEQRGVNLQYPEEADLAG